MDSEQGQAESTPAGTTDNAPAAPATTEQTADPGTVTANEDAIFDFNEIKGKPELEAAFRSMQSNYTKKTQELAKMRKEAEAKINAYDSFYKDPIAEIQRIAAQNGYTLTKAQAAQLQNESATEPQFNTWNEAVEFISQRTRQDVLNELRPVIEQVNNAKTQSHIQYLDTNYPDWRLYEDGMKETLAKHPSMIDDLDGLYRISVPDSVLKARYTKDALKKLKGETDAALISGGGAQSKDAPAPKKARSFDEAVLLAKQQIANRR
jgi:hypothetical protein